MLTKKTAKGMQKWADIAVRRITAQEAFHSGKVPPCRKGCSACCYEAVTADRREVIMIVDAVEKLPPEVQEDIRKRADDVGPKAKEWNEKNPGWEDRKKGGLEYLRKQLPCPLLDLETGLCRVYAERPFSCRVHVALSPSRNCLPDSRLSQMYIRQDQIGMIVWENVPVPEGEEEIEILPALLQEELASRRKPNA